LKLWFLPCKAKFFEFFEQSCRTGKETESAELLLLANISIKPATGEGFEDYLGLIPWIYHLSPVDIGYTAKKATHQIWTWAKMVLTSNERVQRLEKQGLEALRSRSFAKAEKIFIEELAMLRDFRHIDELSLAMALNNLSLALALQGKSYRAENLRRTSLQIASESAKRRPADFLSVPRAVNG